MSQVADGTLIGGESTDWTSFDAAFEEVAGFALDDAFFESIEEVTAQANRQPGVLLDYMLERAGRQRPCFTVDKRLWRATTIRWPYGTLWAWGSNR